jgi:ATP-dependent RNA helicase DeaD
MIRLKLNTGKYHGVRPNDVVGMIAYHADIPGNTIGKIRIEDKHTLVDIPEQFVDKVLASNGDYRIGKHKFALERA